MDSPPSIQSQQYYYSYRVEFVAVLEDESDVPHKVLQTLVLFRRLCGKLLLHYLQRHRVFDDLIVLCQLHATNWEAIS